METMSDDGREYDNSRVTGLVEEYKILLLVRLPEFLESIEVEVED